MGKRPALWIVPIFSCGVFSQKKRRTPCSTQVKPRHVCEQDFSVKSCMQCTKLLPCTVCSTLWQFLSSLMCLDHMDWRAAENSGKRHIMAHKIYVTHSMALTCSQGRGLFSYIPRNHSRGYVGARAWYYAFMPSHMKQKRPHTFFSVYQGNMQQQRMISYFSMNNEKICERATLVSNTNSFWHLDTYGNYDAS